MRQNISNSNNQIDLTEGSTLKNLVRLSFPIILSNFLQMFYNITDIFWLGKLGETAKDAVSVAGMVFPLIFFILSFGFGFVVAGTSLISQYKGANETDKMKLVVGQFCLILIAFTIFFILISTLFIEDILFLLKTPESIFEKAISYFTLILSGMPAMFIFLSFQSFSRGLGDTISPLKVQFITIMINVVLDPIFIFGLSIFPKMGITGAGLATLIARIVSAIFSILFIKKKIPELIPSLRHLKPKKSMLKRIIDISIPASVGQSVTSFGFLILQGFINSYGTLIISTFSIGRRMTSFFMVPSMGISHGLAAVVGQNLGANKIKRAERSFLIALGLTLGLMFVGTSFTFVYGSQLTKFFINKPDVIELGKGMFKLLSVAAFTFSAIFVIMGVFNGSGHTKPVMFFNITRLWLIRIPLVYILSGKLLAYSFLEKIPLLYRILERLSLPLQNEPYNALWWSMVISNFVILIMALYEYSRGKWKRAKIYD